jgi:mannose-6-phosphate isomerase-like protein (cupin superfamily)
MGLMFERDITPTANIAAGIVILPAGEEQTKLSVHEGEEIYYVVRGTGQFVLDERVVDVEQGTAVYIAPGVGHRAINTGDEEMELYWVNTPPVFGPVGAYRDLMKDWERIR